MKKKLLFLMTLLICFCLASCTKDINQVIEEEKNYNPANETVTIIFENNDGSIISNQILKYGDKIKIPENFEKSDSPRYTYTFVGWDLNADNKVEQIPDIATSSFVAKAIYEYSLNKYEVVFNPECDSYSGQLIQPVGFGQSAEPPTELVKEGYDFVSWDKAYDYIVGATVITAIWERHKFTIHLSGNDRININSMEDYKVDAFYGYCNTLPIPNKIYEDLVFNGWKDQNGKMISNEFGDLLEPLCSFDDVCLEIDFSRIETNGVYTLSKLHRNEISDNELISNLNNYIKENDVTSEYFYYENELYYQKDSSFEHGYLLDYINLGKNDTIWYFDDSATQYIFLSLDVIDFTLVENYQSTLEKFYNDSELLIGYKDSISLPYARKKNENFYYEDDYDESLLDTLMYDKTNNCYRTDCCKNMHLLGNESFDVSLLTYLVANTNMDKNIPYQYTNVNGDEGIIESNVEYGLRYVISSQVQKR